MTDMTRDERRCMCQGVLREQRANAVYTKHAHDESAKLCPPGSSDAFGHRLAAAAWDGCYIMGTLLRDALGSRAPLSREEADTRLAAFLAAKATCSETLVGTLNDGYDTADAKLDGWWPAAEKQWLAEQFETD
jgi:hypothetical protein